VSKKHPAPEGPYIHSSADTLAAGCRATRGLDRRTHRHARQLGAAHYKSVLGPQWGPPKASLGWTGGKLHPPGWPGRTSQAPAAGVCCGCSWAVLATCAPARTTLAQPVASWAMVCAVLCCAVLWCPVQWRAVLCLASS
jgi:hypothetical protein